jgi:hypothetical protein
MGKRGVRKGSEDREELAPPDERLAAAAARAAARPRCSPRHVGHDARRGEGIRRGVRGGVGAGEHPWSLRGGAGTRPLHHTSMGAVRWEIIALRTPTTHAGDNEELQLGQGAGNRPTMSVGESREGGRESALKLGSLPLGAISPPPHIFSSLLPRPRARAAPHAPTSSALPAGDSCAGSVPGRRACSGARRSTVFSRARRPLRDVRRPPTLLSPSSHTHHAHTNTMSRSALQRELARNLREGGGQLPLSVTDPFSVVDATPSQEAAAGSRGLQM